MTIESLVNTYGYLAVLIGTFFEGETILVWGGVAAHRGYMALPWVILAGFIGSLCGDQLFFFLGRWHSQNILGKHPSWKIRVDKAQRVLERFRIPLILGFRFLYGMRTVTPFMIGMSTVPILKFVFLNAVGALVWAIVVGTGGYLFGSALEILIDNIKHYELEVLVAIAATGGLIWAIYLYHRRRHRSSPVEHSESV